MPSPMDFMGGMPGPEAGGGPLGSLPGADMGGGGPMPGMGGGPGANLAMSAMDKLIPGQGKNPTQTLSKVDEALTLSHKLIMAVLPQVENINPKVAKDLHQIGRSLLSLKLDVKKEMPVGPPPELMAGLQNLQGAPAPGTGMGVGLPGPSMGV